MDPSLPVIGKYLGLILSGEFDGLDWTLTPSHSLTNKEVMAISLLPSGKGWYLCRPGSLESPEFGTVNDTMIVYWDQ